MDKSPHIVAQLLYPSGFDQKLLPLCRRCSVAPCSLPAKEGELQAPLEYLPYENFADAAEERDVPPNQRWSPCGQ